MPVERTLPNDSEAVRDILARYGVSAPIAEPSAPHEIDNVLQSYGIVLKPGSKNSKVETRAVEPVSSDLKLRPNGTVIEPDIPIAPADLRAGNERGLRAQAISGIPIAGPLIDLATAAVPVAGKADTFGQRFYDQQRADQAFARENPWSSAAANVAGSTLGYGGLAKAIPSAFGMVGPTLAARFYGGLGGGAAINALDAGLRGENPITGAEIGGAGGAAGPLLAGGARGLTGMAANYAWPRPGPLQNIPRAGINVLAQALEGETPATLAAGMKRMGPHGFLADAAPGLTDIAGAIADTRGPGKAIVRQAYANRADQQGDRIEAALTRAMGPRQNMVDLSNIHTEIRKLNADPLYEQWRTMQVHPTPEIKALIPRLEASGAFNAAEELGGITGKPLNKNFFTGGSKKDFPTTETWDMVKQGLDRRIDAAYSSNDKKLASKLIELKGELIGNIEKTPAGDVWRRARREFADRSGIIDQLTAGRDTFVGGRSGTTVDEMREELKHLSRPELMARIQGTRDIASEAMGATKNGDTTLRNKLLAPNNQDKIKMLLGQKDGDGLIKALKQEEYLGNQTSNVLGNIQTGASGSMRSERRKMFDAPELPSWFDHLNATMPATWIPPSFRPHNVLQAIMSEKAGRAAPALAPLMTMGPGPQMDELVNALHAEAARSAKVQRLSGPFANALGFGASGPGEAFYRRNIENNQSR